MSVNLACPVPESRAATPRRMACLLIIALLSGPGSALADWAVFKSAPIGSAESQTIRGPVSRPDGAGPFPAIIIAHGHFGIESSQRKWARCSNGGRGP